MLTHLQIVTSPEILLFLLLELALIRYLILWLCW